jgi:ABC-type dipeptide/oligopeptide/nickel transport system permease subunit
MPWREVIRLLLRRKIAVACFFIMCGFALVAITADWLVPDDVLFEQIGLDATTGLERPYHPPGWFLYLNPDHGHFDNTGLNEATKERNPTMAAEARDWGFFDQRTWHLPFGADIGGVSVLARLIRGVKLAFLIGLVPTIISSIIATLMGLAAGYFGKWIDDLITYIISVLASIPLLLLLIAFIQAVRESEGITELFMAFGVTDKAWRNLLLVLIVIGLTTWVGLCRLVRAEVLKHKNRDYVHAARALGCGEARILFRHIMPNVFHVVIITFTISFVGAVSLEVYLSYVGIGVEATLQTWGRVITAARSELQRSPSVWWPLAGATGFLFMLSLSFSIFGDALRDALDPKLRT